MPPRPSTRHQSTRPSGAALVAHSSPIVSLGVIRLLRDRRADVVRVVDSMDAWRACCNAPVRLLIGDHEGVATCLGAGPGPDAIDDARLMIASGRCEPAKREGRARWLSIECLEEELLAAVDELIESRRSHGSAAHGLVGDAGSGLAPGVRRRLLAHIDRRLGEPMEARELAGIAGLSECHFARAFKQSFGSPPHRFVMTRRIEQAARRVELTDEPLSDIALDFGFSDQSHFTRLFGRFVGETPSAYRSRHRGPTTHASRPQHVEVRPSSP